MDASALKTNDETTMQSSSCRQASVHGTQSSYIGSIQALSTYYDDEEEAMQNSLKHSLHRMQEQKSAPSSPLPFALDDLPAIDNNSISISRHQKLQIDGCTEHSPGSEGGIVILNPDDDDDEHDEDEILWNNSLHLEQHHHQQHVSEPLDSIIVAAAARVDAQRGRESFEKLMKQAESGCHDNNLEVEEQDLPTRSFWSRFQRGSLSNPGATQGDQRVTGPFQQHAPARITQIAHDKFLIEVDIPPNNYRANVRDAMDILANVDLLHLWFDPIPAVFDSTIKDGSGSYSIDSNRNGERQERHRDGEWVEISSPPLVLPRDSRISSCIRLFRVTFRAMIGFPARIRSTILIERSACRMGMTIGPYPDGMTAHHDFNVKMDEERIVVSDEVRLHRNEADCFCFCWIMRLIFRMFEWILVRWYQPDLASYMSQTAASMEKLRRLIERGEGAAYASDELMMERDDWEGGGNNDATTLISSPLLG
jgi:hypothetical protein